MNQFFNWSPFQRRSDIAPCLDELKSFSSGLEKGVVKFRDRHARAQRLEHITWSDQYHIYHRGGYLPIYHEEDYYYNKGVVIDTVKILFCLLPKGRPRLFWIL